MEKMEIALGEDERIYVYADCVRSDSFRISPYQSRFIALLVVSDERQQNRYAIYDEWRQEGHPCYSDCCDGSLVHFASRDEAEKTYDEKVKEYEKAYPWA